MALEGMNAHQIAKTLENEQILVPRAYKFRKSGKDLGTLSSHPYSWSVNTVLTLLKNPVYTGNLACLRSEQASIKNKKKNFRPEEEWVITENTHQALVSQQDFDTVGERIKSKQRTKETNPLNLYRGLVHCSDCGVRMSFSSNSRGKPTGSFRCPRNVRYGKLECTPHPISIDILNTVVLSDIKRHAGLAEKNIEKYVEYLTKSTERESIGKNNSLKKEADKCNKRLIEIDSIIQKLYEDKVFGIVTQERFVSMSSALETEQAELKKRHAELIDYLDSCSKKSNAVGEFTKLIKQYTDICALDSELIHTLIEKIIIHEREIIDSETVVKIDIFYRFIGNVAKYENNLTSQGYCKKHAKTA
jgi:hypothetical protein